VDDYTLIDGDMAFSSTSSALKFYREQYNKKKQWQGLTDEEILEEYRQSYGDDGNLTDVYFARAIEATLKEKCLT
jgi:hypothetical protein